MEYRIHHSVQSIAADQWDGLLVPTDSPFVRHSFLSSLESSGCATPQTGWHPRFVTAWHQGRMVGGLPLYRKDHCNGEFIFDWSWADAAHRARMPYFPKLTACIPFSPVDSRRFLVAPGASDGDVIATLLSGARQAAEDEPATGIHWLFVTEAEQAELASHGILARDTLQFHWENRGYESFDDYLGALKSKRRAQIRRERRLVSEAGVSVDVVRGDEASVEDREAVWRYYCKTVAQYTWSDRYLNETFFKALFENQASDILLLLARQDGKTIAGTFNMVQNGVFYGRYWGCEVDIPCLHFEVCLYKPIELAIERGYSTVQPGAGGHHKIARGFLPKVVRSSHEIYLPGLREAVAEAVAHESRHNQAVAEAGQCWNWKKG